MTFAKNFKLAEKRPLTFQADTHKIFNRNRFSSINSTSQCSAASYVQYVNGTRSMVQSNSQLGRPTGARAPGQLSMSLRLKF